VQKIWFAKNKKKKVRGKMVWVRENLQHHESYLEMWGSTERWVMVCGHQTIQFWVMRGMSCLTRNHVRISCVAGQFLVPPMLDRHIIP
jgi:hypothetical protein